MGKATAADLAKRGGKVYFACRSEKRAMQALNDVKEQTGSNELHFLQLDLSSFQSIKEFSKKFHKLEPKLHILVNNAGSIWAGERTTDGNEMNMGTNYLGHFLLTNLLLDLLKAGAPSRVVVVSSTIHKIGSINKNDFNCDANFPGKFKAFANSKLANILFAREFSKRLEGSGVTANSLCPGCVKTEGTENLEKSNIFIRIFMSPIRILFFQTPEVGCSTQVMLAVEPELENVSGKHFKGCKEVNASAEGRDDETAAWLWNKSLELTNQ